MWWYSAFLSATLGADNFDTRQAWHDLLSAPLFRLPMLFGIMHSDPEVAYRCRLICNTTLHLWLKDEWAWKVLPAVMKEPDDKDIDKDAAWWGDTKHVERSHAIDRVCRSAGLMADYEVVPFGVEPTRKWLILLRERHKDKSKMAKKGPPIEIPQPMPLEKP